MRGHEPPDALLDLPPSAKLVYTILAEEGTLTQQEIVSESYLPVRTVRHALTRLEDIELVTETVGTCDARKRYYRLQSTESAPNTNYF